MEQLKKEYASIERSPVIDPELRDLLPPIAYDHTLAPRAKDDVILDPDRYGDYDILDADDILYPNPLEGDKKPYES